MQGFAGNQHRTFMEHGEWKTEEHEPFDDCKIRSKGSGKNTARLNFEIIKQNY